MLHTDNCKGMRSKVSK